MSDGQRIFLIAGEPSGDQLGSALMQAMLKKAKSGLEFKGVGGPAMTEQGLASLFPMRDLTVLGFTEVLPHLLRLYRRMRQTVEAIEAFQPDAVVSIDSPGFVNPVIEKLKKRGKVAPKFIHYVAPTVWAYRPGRAKTVAALYDHLMVLLPFEQPYFAKEGLPTSFVGHPVVDDLDICFAKRRPAHERPVNRLTLCLLAGSRSGEIDRLLPIYRRTVELLRPSYPDLSLVMPVAEDMQADMERRVADWPVKPRVVSGMMEKYEAYYASDVALAKSGTVTLEIAKCGLPMVMTYRVNTLSAMALKWIVTTRYFNLINVLMERPVIPELLQGNAKPKKLAEAIRGLANSPLEVEKQKRGCYEALARMHAPNGRKAAELAAETVLGQIRPVFR